MKKAFKIVGISLASLMLIIFVAVMIFNCVYIKSKVSGSSMMPTLQAGDRVFINRFEEGKLNDIVVANISKAENWPKQEEGNYVIKRLIAKENDRVKLVKNNNFKIELYVNGEQISSTDVSVSLNSYYHFLAYIETNALNQNRIRDGEILVNKDEVFLAGDNYEDSFDCFSCGPITKKCLVGRVDIVVEKNKNIVWGAIVGCFKRLF